MMLKNLSTQDLLKLLERADEIKEVLDQKAATHDLVSGLLAEGFAGLTTLMINKMSILLLGSAVLSPPVLLAILVGSGLCGTYYPKMKASLQRHYLYREYSTISEQIDYIKGILGELDESSK